MAVRCLEEGRAQQLGARLREQEAQLSPEDREALDGARQAFGAAETAADQARKRASDVQTAFEAATAPDARAKIEPRRRAAAEAREAAEAQVAEAHRSLGQLKAQIRLEDVTVPVPEVTALRAALGPATLAQAVPGKDCGWLLLLALDQEAWETIAVPGLTQEAVTGVTDRYLAALTQFEEAVAQHGDSRPVNDFSRALEAEHLAAFRSLITGPLHQALTDAGQPPANGANLAPEVVLCLPADLSMLPLASTRDAQTGRPFYEDYALRFVPSLGALVSAAARARRPVSATALTVLDPLGDLDMPVHPAAGLFAPDGLTELRSREDPMRADSASWAGLRTAVEHCSPGYIAYFGHSHWDRRDGEGSGLVLAPAPDQDGEGHNEHYDLATPVRIRDLQLGATRLVFSASCGGAGLSLVTASDEMGGLPAAWLEAGAAGMVSSLYTVFTDSAAETMQLMLRAHLQEGLSPAQALRHAQITLADKLIRRETAYHPTAQVAPYILVGA